MTPRTAYILFAILFGIIIGLLVMVRINPLIGSDVKPKKDSVNIDSLKKAISFPDTISVRLLNLPIAAGAADNNNQKKPQPSSSAEENNNSIEKNQPQNSVQDTFKQAGRWLPANKYPTAALTDSVSIIAKENLLLAKDKQRQRTMWWSALIGLIMLFVLMEARHIWNRHLSIEDILKRGDDEKLISIIKNNEQTIRQLGNPRKIKRFINKLKFQFYYLNSKQVFATNEAANLQYFFEVFAAIQKNSLLMNSDTKSPLEIKNELPRMDLNVTNDPIKTLNGEDILNALLKLNMNVVG